MPRTRYRIGEPEHAYFLTCTIVGWLPVFTRPEAVEILFESLRFLQREKGLQLFGYVVMENHAHLIAAAPDLAGAIKSFKMFTARRLIDLLKSRGEASLLRQLRALKRRHKTKSEFQVWQEGSKPKQIVGDGMFRQKLEYTHLNPVARGYVEEATHWRYSSAPNYAGLPGPLEVILGW